MNNRKKEQSKLYIKADLPVLIYKNDEVGILQWSIAVVGTDFWLASFSTKERCVRYCNKMKLSTVNVYEYFWKDLDGEDFV